MSLSSSVIKKVSNQIYKQFPEMKDVSPRVQKQSSPKNKQIYLLKYETTVTGGGGSKIKRWVRATVDEKGKVIRTSTSR